MASCASCLTCAVRTAHQPSGCRNTIGVFGLRCSSHGKIPQANNCPRLVCSSYAATPSWLRRGGDLRRRFLGFAVSRPALFGGFPYGLQPGRRELPLLGLRRCCGLRLLLFLRRPSRPLRGGDPGAASFADRAALLRTRVIRSGCRGDQGLWPARTALTELRFDVGYLRRDSVELALIADDGHLQQGVVLWLCLSWHIGSPIEH